MFMLEWLFPFCSREEKTNEPMHNVRFSRTIWIRIFSINEPGYLLDMSYNML
jgi:hypothetical protein